MKNVLRALFKTPRAAQGVPANLGAIMSFERHDVVDVYATLRKTRWVDRNGHISPSRSPGPAA